MSLNTPQISYGPEVCGLCRGNGTNPDHPCPACDGQGTVMARQPALSCPRCGGDGRAETSDEAFYHSPLCLVCRGTGWVMTLSQPPRTEGRGA
jgi:DnaJ-class molecular chaperone